MTQAASPTTSTAAPLASPALRASVRRSPELLPYAPAKPVVNPWLVALTVSMATFMEVLDTSIANVSLNHIAGNLACFGNSMVWDSADLSTTGSLYPRLPEPNTVGGERVGQCVLASAKDQGGPLGPGPF